MIMPCEHCDRPDCPRDAAVEAASAAYVAVPFSKPEMSRAYHACNAAIADCTAHTVDWRERALAAEARIKDCAAALAEIERSHPDDLDDYSKGFRHGCQDMIAILYGPPPT